MVQKVRSNIHVIQLVGHRKEANANSLPLLQVETDFCANSRQSYTNPVNPEHFKILFLIFS